MKQTCSPPRKLVAVQIAASQIPPQLSHTEGLVSVPKFVSRTVVVFSIMLVALAAAPHAMWGQQSWPNYPNNSAITVTSSGNVGISTSTPNALLSLGAQVFDYQYGGTRLSKRLHAAPVTPWEGGVPDRGRRG